MTDAPDILKKIVETKREEIAESKRVIPLSSLQSRISDREDQPRGFARALQDAYQSGWTPIIAEVKKGSPSKGVIREDFDPVEIAGIYQDSGAVCLSVLTDEKYFLGHLRYLSIIREQVSLPLLRKDFIIDPYQVYESYLAGADAILLIASILSKEQIIELNETASGLDLDVLIEVHNEDELEKAVAAESRLIGVNNRDLRTFKTDISATARLAALLPDDRFLISESGINSRADIEKLTATGAKGFLIGEALMREDDIAAKLAELLGQ